MADDTPELEVPEQLDTSTLSPDDLEMAKRKAELTSLLTPSATPPPPPPPQETPAARIPEPEAPSFKLPAPVPAELTPTTEQKPVQEVSAKPTAPVLRAPTMGSEVLAQQRARLKQELDLDPELKARLAVLATAEEGKDQDA